MHGTKALAPLAAHLEHLDLSGSATLTSEALGCLLQRRGAEGCGAGLRRLLLRSCDDAVTDELLAAFLPRAHALEHLDVSFCTALTDITARLLSSGKARGLRRLRSVDVSNCRRITQRGLDALRNALHGAVVCDADDADADASLEEEPPSPPGGAYAQQHTPSHARQDSAIEALEQQLLLLSSAPAGPGMR